MEANMCILVVSVEETNPDLPTNVFSDMLL